ncbi:MAG: ABC transporter permease [Defluviitaleaceae bacterium]|nr:ABC transporter permease [Defluviitaleaceae bacterium]
MNQFKAVLGFEFGAYVKSKGYKIFTLIMIAIALLGGLIPNLISNINFGGGRERPPVGIHDLNHVLSDENLNAFIGEGAWVRMDISNYENIEEELENETYAHIFMVDGDEYTVILLGSAAMTFSFHTYRELARETHLAAVFTGLGQSPTETSQILNTIPEIDLVLVGRDLTQSFIIGYVLVFVLYFAVMIYCQFVTTSVVREKSTKTMEMLVVSVKSIHMMFGKVFGVALAGLLQLVAILGATAIGLTLFGDGLADIHEILGMLTFADVAPLLGWAFAFFLLGFFSIAFVSAGIGSMVDKMEDVGQANMISTLVMVGSLLIAMTGIATPNSSLMVAASMIPLISPVIMFMRICLVEVPVYQIIISIGGSVITILLLGVLSAKIYRAGVLMYGTKPTIGNIVKSLRKA